VILIDKCQAKLSSLPILAQAPQKILIVGTPHAFKRVDANALQDFLTCPQNMYHPSC